MQNYWFTKNPGTTKSFFEEITPDGVNNKKFGLRIAQVVWFWHIFVFKKDFTGKAGKLLSMEYY